jgi:hypothetical protein
MNNSSFSSIEDLNAALLNQNPFAKPPFSQIVAGIIKDLLQNLKRGLILNKPAPTPGKN